VCGALLDACKSGGTRTQRPACGYKPHVRLLLAWQTSTAGAHAQPQAHVTGRACARRSRAPATASRARWTSTARRPGAGGCCSSRTCRSALTQFYAVYPARCSPCQLPHTTQPFSKRAAALQDALGLHSHVLAPCPVLHRHIMWASCAACIQALTQRASAAPTAVHRRSWACPAVDANMHVWGHAFAQQRRARAEQACFKAGSRAVRFCCFPALLFANLLFFCLARGGCARHLLCAQGSGRSPLRFHTS